HLIVGPSLHMPVRRLPPLTALLGGAAFAHPLEGVGEALVPDFDAIGGRSAILTCGAITICARPPFRINIGRSAERAWLQPKGVCDDQVFLPWRIIPSRLRSVNAKR